MVTVIAPIGCSSKHEDNPPPTIVPAVAAVSPAVAGQPQGSVRPLAGIGEAAAFDPATSSLVVLELDPAGGSAVTTFPPSGPSRTVPLPGPATAIVADGDGAVYLSAKGGYFKVDVKGAGKVTRFDVDGQRDTDFTAITRRADGKVVLGSADGAVYTLDSATAVGARLQIFARVDALAVQGNTVAVLDRGQTSVTTVDVSGTKQEHALRAGEGATTMVTDPAGRILVADTRGQSLLVFGTNPLMLRQQSPVRGAPYGLAGSRGLAWVSETATNSVVGYDLATGIPVEKVRYRTVQQPNSLIFDDTTGTLYVVSGSGAGVQVIPRAGR
jgi:DNA-binding beta-propeller fold protein YncE